jgi:hypothetical protein
MSKRSRRLVLVYLTLLIALAALGAYNQALYRQHWTLLHLKQERQIELSSLRAEAAHITGPLAVRAWALERGMVSTPEGHVEAQQVIAVRPPQITLPQGGWEIRTVWR